MKKLTAIVTVMLLGMIVVSMTFSRHQPAEIIPDVSEPEAASSSPALHRDPISEQEFLTVLFPLHLQAIATASYVLEHGTPDVEIRGIAEEIVNASSDEIILMQQWHEAWFSSALTVDSSITPLIADIESLSEHALDSAFLSAIIPHFEQTVALAQAVLPQHERAEIREFASAIIVAHSAERAIAREALARLEGV